MYKKALGQHFFVNKTFLERLVELTNVNKSDIVLEIGTGKGTLTTILQKKVGYVVSIEVDSTWFNIAKNIVPKENVTILNTNILFKKSLNPEVEKLLVAFAKERSLIPKVVSSPPYNIIGILIEALIASKVNFRSIYLMVQKEVGERLVALPGNKDYSSLSVFVQSFCKVDIIAQIHKGNFFPTPAVDSVLVSILPFSQFSSDYLHYSKFLKSVFSMRRKNFLKVIKKIYGKESVNKIISRFEISSLARPEEIPPQLFKEIYITLLRTN